MKIAVNHDEQCEIKLVIVVIVDGDLVRIPKRETFFANGRHLGVTFKDFEVMGPVIAFDDEIPIITFNADSFFEERMDAFGLGDQGLFSIIKPVGASQRKEFALDLIEVFIGR